MPVDNKFFPVLPGASPDVRKELIQLRTYYYGLLEKLENAAKGGPSKLTVADLDFIRKNLQVGGKTPINVTNLLGGNTTSNQTSPITSVGLSMPSEFTVANSPITDGEGTLIVEKASQTNNRVYASPDGSNGQPSFRALVVSDIPNLPESKITNLTTDLVTINSAIDTINDEIDTINTELAGLVPESRTISTTAPLTGGGDLSANRTLAVSPATSGALGVVKPDNTTITIDGSGVISAVGGGGGGFSPYGDLNSPPPSVSTLTWVNQGGATATDVGGGILVTAPANASASWRLLMRALPTPPYTFTVYWALDARATNGFNSGIVLRDSATGRLVSFGTAWGAGASFLAGNYWTNPTTFSSSPGVVNWVGVDSCFLRVTDDGTNLTFAGSRNGRDFNTYKLSSLSRTAWLANPDQIGIGLSSENSVVMSVYVSYWSI